MLRSGRRIAIPGSAGGAFDHGAHEPATGRVFVAHTSADSVEVLDCAAGLHVGTVAGASKAAGVVAAGGRVLVTARGTNELMVIDAATLKVTARFETGTRPNGLAFAPARDFAVVACLGDDSAPPSLERIELSTGLRRAIELPGRPRWCVMDPAEEHVYCAIGEPSMIFVADLQPLEDDDHWLLPAAGAHGIDLDELDQRLYVSCDSGRLLAVSTETGELEDAWPLPGRPDATWFNPGNGLVHVSIAGAGCVATVRPQAHGPQVSVTPTGVGSKTSALVLPDRLLAFLPETGEALELVETRGRTED